MRPKSIILFERLFLTMIVVGVLNGFLNFTTAKAQLQADPQAAAMFGSGFLIGAIILGVIINLLLWFFVARKGSVVAKWIVVVFFGLSLLGIVTSLPNLVFPTALLSFLALILQGAAVYMLFRPDAVAWLKGDRTADTDVFE